MSNPFDCGSVGIALKIVIARYFGLTLIAMIGRPRADRDCSILAGVVPRSRAIRSSFARTIRASNPFSAPPNPFTSSTPAPDPFLAAADALDPAHARAPQQSDPFGDHVLAPARVQRADSNVRLNSTCSKRYVIERRYTHWQRYLRLWRLCCSYPGFGCCR